MMNGAGRVDRSTDKRFPFAQTFQAPRSVLQTILKLQHHEMDI
jgi:hypothetical protein